MRKSLALIVALAALLTGLLSGCANSPATAAKVGDTVITERQVQDLGDRISDAVGLSRADARNEALPLLIQGELGRRVVADGVAPVSDADRQQVLAQVAPKALADPMIKAALADMANLEVVAQKLGGPALFKAVETIPVEVNPIHGAWDPQTISVSPTSQALAELWRAR